MNRQLLNVTLSAAILACALVVLSTTLAIGQASPQFRLGFATLASLIPDVVGTPLEEEHYGANGDSLQQTTTGLMVWRKADNWTAFTDGSRTWANGPNGLQERDNNQRFDWERQATVASTAVTAFRPAGVRGAEQEGYCWTDSLSSWQPDAWRCMVGNRIYDPCFGIAGDDTAVVCGASPLGDGYGFRLRLTQPLPARGPVPSGTHAWMLDLADGVSCGFLTGASTGVEGERANYGCTDGWYVLGDPQPGQPWTAREVQIQMTAQGPTLLDSATVEISKVWQ